MEIGDKTDYHLHTWYSDGRYSPEDVVARAKELGLTHIAITDHDGTRGLAEGRAAAEKLGIDLTNGIELSTITTSGIGLHILGYDIDPEDRELNEVCDEVLARRKERNDRFLRALKEDGYEVTEEELLAENGHGFIGKPVFARILVRKGYVSSKDEVFDKIFSSPKYDSIKKKKIPAEEAMRLIRGAGGRPALAHPALIKGIGERGTEEFFENAEAIVQRMLGHGLFGIECYYPGFSSEETERFAKMADRYGLTATRGSDYHGD